MRVTVLGGEAERERRGPVAVGMVHGTRGVGRGGAGTSAGKQVCGVQLKDVP